MTKVAYLFLSTSNLRQMNCLKNYTK